MNLQQLYYFQAIFRKRNFTRAAEQLNITQSSLSHSIADLEKELGVPLFLRQGRSIVPSSYANRFYGHVERIIQELDLAKEEIRADLNPSTGVIHIGMSYTLSLSFMPRMIRRFCEQPGNEYIRFEWVELTAAYVNSALLDHTIDLGFAALIEHRNLDSFQVSADEVALIVPMNHPLAGYQGEVPFEALNGEHLVTFPYTCGTRYYIDSILNANHVVPSQITEVDTEKLMAGLVSAGRGIAILPVLPDLGMYDVAKLRLEGERLYRPMYMIWENKGFLSPVVRKFRDFVMNQVRDNALTERH